MRNIIITETISETEQKVWTFWFYDRDVTLYLDSFVWQTRETKRHKFVTNRKYERLNSRNSNLALEEVELPDSVIEKAREEFLSMMNVPVIKWNK